MFVHLKSHFVELLNSSAHQNVLMWLGTDLLFHVYITFDVYASI